MDLETETNGSSSLYAAPPALVMDEQSAATSSSQEEEEFDTPAPDIEYCKSHPPTSAEAEEATAIQASQAPEAVAEVEIRTQMTESLKKDDRQQYRALSPDTLQEQQYKRELRHTLQLSNTPVITVTLESDGETEEAPERL